MTFSSISLRRVLAVLFIFGLAQMPLALVAQQAAPSPKALPIVSRTLANGLKVIVAENHAVSVVQTAVWYRFGAQNETLGKTGLAHGLEHMMFRGTPSVSGGGLDDITARLGAQVNANTANDYTHYYLVMPADKLELALHLEADRMQNLLLREQDWRLEKGAVLSEYDGDLGQPLVRLYDRVCRTATTARVCGLSALGERADIVRSTAADLRAYYNRYYVPNNATLVVTGDVAADDVFARATRLFGSVARKQIPEQRPARATYTSGKSVSLSADYPYEVVDLAFPAPGSEDAGSAPMQIVDSVINNQRSEFYRALVVSGLSLGYSSSFDQNVHDGLYHVFLTVSPGHRGDEARTAFLATLAKLQTKGFPADLVDAAKIAVATQAVYARDSITGLGDRIGYAIGVEGIADPAEDDAKVAAATVDDVTAAAKKYLAAPAVTGVLLPTRGKSGDSGGPPSGGVGDNFSNRAPTGPIVLASWVTGALAKPSVLESKVKPATFTLPNGIRVFVQSVHTNPTIFIRGSIERSARFDPIGKEGLGTMVATLLSFGSEKYDFEGLRKITDEIGVNVSVGSSFEAHGLAKDLPVILDVLADAEQHPTFPPKYVDLVRAQTLSTIARRDQDPDYRAGRAFSQLLLPPGDPALRETSMASIKSISLDDLRQFAHRYQRPDLTTISVVGDVAPEDVRAKLEAAFGSWQADGPKPDASARPIPLPKPASKFILAQRREVSVRLGQPMPSRRSPDFYALNLMNAILGGGGTFDTRLMHEIREKRGLVYGASSSLNVDKYRGTLTFALSANPKNVRAALAILRAELVRLQTERPSAAEVDRARKKLVSGALVGEESTDGISARIQNIGLNDLPVDYYATLAARYAAVKPADIERVARTYLKPNNLIEVYEGPRN